MEQLWERMEALEHRCEQAERRCREAQAQHQEAERRWRQAARRAQVQGGVAVAAVVGALLLSPGSRAALAQGYGATLGGMAQRVAALERESADLHSQVTPLTNLFLARNPVDGQPFFSRRGTDICITGANLHLVNGLGATNGLPDSPDSINIAGRMVSSVVTCTSKELTKKYARSVRQPRRKTRCSGCREKSRSIGMNTAE